VIERLKSEISVQRLAEARGVLFTRHGADLIGRCCFHEDKTPSLVVTPAKNSGTAWGVPGRGYGDRLVMRAEGVSFRHAAELLLNDSIPLAASATGALPPKRSSVRKLPTPIERNAEDAKLLIQVIDYYHETLLAVPRRSIISSAVGSAPREAIKTFKLGYANRTLGYRLPQKNRVEGAAMRGQLQRIGLLRESGHEHFNGSIVILSSIRAVKSRKSTDAKSTTTCAKARHCTCIYRGRIAACGTPRHWQLQRKSFLCEALIDALSFWCAGYRNVTASYGVEASPPITWPRSNPTAPSAC